jgi:hypothetical protein
MRTLVHIWRGLDIALILGFVMVDFFLFHDFLKAGESFSFVQYLIGVLSIVVILRSIITLKY